MYSFFNKVKISYLLLVIFFCMGIFFYLLDSWQIINLEDYVPWLSEEVPLVAEDVDAPSELEWESLRKKEKLLKEQQLQLQEQTKRFEEQKQNLQNGREELQAKIDSLEKEKAAFHKRQERYDDYQTRLSQMATRLKAMPPEDVASIISSWSNSDLKEVLLQMERDAEANNELSIVPYLLTLMPRERAALLMALMLETRGKQK